VRILLFEEGVVLLKKLMTISVKNGARQLATHGLLWLPIFKELREYDD